MKLLIGIATFKRTSKLERLLQSLENSTYKDFRVEIVCDNKDFETYDYLRTKGWLDKDNYLCILQDKQSWVIGAWNRVVQENIQNTSWNGFLGLVDDIELEPDALQKAVDFHIDRFADGDGVIGFNQECPGHPEYNFKWFGQTLMGRKFVERYKECGYQICCPDYKHFHQDAEMYEFALSLDKFYPCKQAILNHDHPSFTGNIDETHNIIRQGKNSPRQHDANMLNWRKAAGYCWGKDFNLIGE